MEKIWSDDGDDDCSVWDICQLFITTLTLADSGLRRVSDWPKKINLWPWWSWITRNWWRRHGRKFGDQKSDEYILSVLLKKKNSEFLIAFLIHSSAGALVCFPREPVYFIQQFMNIQNTDQRELWVEYMVMAHNLGKPLVKKCEFKWILAVRGCPYLMSANFGGFHTPPPPLVSNRQHLLDPALVSIWPTPLYQCIQGKHTFWY